MDKKECREMKSVKISNEFWSGLNRHNKFCFDLVALKNGLIGLYKLQVLK